MTLPELLQKRAEVQAAMEALDAKVRGEGRDMTPEESAEWERLDGEFESLSAQIKRAQKLEGRRQMLGQSAGTLVGVQGAEGRQAPAVLKIGRGDTEERAMAHYLRTGDMGGLVEARAYNDTDMNVTTDADGGVVVPVGMVQDIVARRDELALFTKLGVVEVPGKGLTVNYPIDNEADVLFTAVDEGDNIGQDAPALTEKAFTLKKYAKYVTLTWELLRDEDAKLLEFLSNWVARGWAGTHNSLLITEALANGTAGLTLDSATAIDETEIPELVGKLAPEYQEGAQWIMHPGTFAYLQGLTGNPFQFMPTPGGSRNTLWGYPVNQSSYATAYQASAKSLIFGNFSFMGKREGTGLTVLRDPYSAAGKGQVRLWFWFDAVYGVLQAEAIQYATHPSA